LHVVCFPPTKIPGYLPGFPTPNIRGTLKTDGLSNSQQTPAIQQQKYCAKVSPAKSKKITTFLNVKPMKPPLNIIQI